MSFSRDEKNKHILFLDNIFGICALLLGFLLNTSRYNKYSKPIIHILIKIKKRFI